MALGLALGVAADAVFGDPRRGHPVAAFGRAAARLERAAWADSGWRGAGFAAACVVPAVALGAGLGRLAAGRRGGTAAATALATWAVLGGESLAREGAAMDGLLAAGDLAAARARLGHLCARDAGGLGRDDLARATVESLAENTSDAVVAPLLWGALAGVPGLLGYRAVNTLDAMVGYRSPRYARFGRAAARADDVANLVPARVTGLLTVALARAVGGSPRAAARVLAADRARHPSPNAGWCEAAAAGALGVRLGGANTYAGAAESRPVLGAGGRAPGPGDIARAVRLTRAVGAAASVLAVALAARPARR